MSGRDVRYGRVPRRRGSEMKVERIDFKGWDGESEVFSS